VPFFPNRNHFSLKLVMVFSLSNAKGSTRHGTRITALANRHSVADNSSDLVVRWATWLGPQLPSKSKSHKVFLNGRLKEIKDAIKLEEERRAALVKNLYRLRALRLSRDRTKMRIAEEGT
jgi:hypothetical protein